ncbi:MAG: FadR/GntR family transcriptional regulator [Chloroflexi bacterium]|nr:FadR/GntR family transcriptional regulator [Chloroflexota bacterium]
MAKLFNSVKRATVAETIVEQVIDLIIDGQLIAGQKLPSERELAEEFSVGRSSVREATSALVALGVAQVRQGEGVYIRPDFPESVINSIDWSTLMLRGQIADLIETRRAIELAIVRLATERAAQSEIRELLRLANKMHISLDIESFIDRDLEFHLALAQSSQNMVMYSVIQGIQQLMRKSMYQVLQRDDMRRIAIEQHRDIAEAISEGDAERAMGAMEEHLMKDVRFFNERGET